MTFSNYMDKKVLKKMEKVIREFFEKMSFEVEVELGKVAENTLPVQVKAPEPQVLIGEHGKTLVEIQRLLGKILRKQAGEQFYLDLDINQYKKNKQQYLKELARELANRVALERREKVLFPMSSYERRVVHLELALRDDVKTESIGEEPDRRVVIKPA